MSVTHTSRLPHLRARAWASLCWAVLAFIALQVGLRLWIDYYRPEWRDPTFEIKARRLQDLVHQAPENSLTVLAVGSSVTSNGFQALALERTLSQKIGRQVTVVNMSSLGATPLTELVWLNRLVQRKVHIDFVCVEVNPMLFGPTGEPPDAIRFPAVNLEACDLDIMERYSGEKDLRANWASFRWLPVYKHRLAIMNNVAWQLVPVQDRMATWGGATDERFWAPLPQRSPEQLQRILDQVRQEHAVSFRAFTPNPITMQALEEVLALLKSKGIGCAVVVMPQGPMLRGFYGEAGLAKFKHEVACHAQNNGFAYLDAFDWFPEEMFADGLHPTIPAAEMFTARIEKEVLLPGLRKRISTTAQVQRNER